MAKNVKKRQTPSLEDRKAALKLQGRGLICLVLLNILLWAATFAEQFLVETRLPWYRSLFHLVTPGVTLFTALIGISTAVEHVRILQESDKSTASLMLSWGVKGLLLGVPGAAVLAGCFYWVGAAPGTAFGLACFPIGIGLGFLFTSLPAIRSETDPDWEQASMLCGLFSVILIAVTAGIGYKLEDTYDAHFALAVWGMPALLFTIICSVRYFGRKRALKQEAAADLAGGEANGR